MREFKRVLVTGGAGYVGAVLVPKLIDNGYRVTVLDLYIYGNDVFGSYGRHPALTEIEGDIRDIKAMRQAVAGCQTVIHLACISNDPSFELDPDLGRSVNYDAFRPLVREAKTAGVKCFIYASSSSVYGIKQGVEVTEDLPLEPLTDYSRLKALCEQVLDEEREPGFVTVTIRPATVCGYSPRQRLDLVVNTLTSHAVCNRKIRVFGGTQLRAVIHIDDMCDLYLLCLELPDGMIDGKVFNAGYENRSVSELADMVKRIVGGGIELETVPSNDLRSYHVSSEKIRRELGFEPKHSIKEAIDDLVKAFQAGKLPDALEDSRYYNIKRMRELKLR